MNIAKTVLLFFLTAVAEIVGCFLPYLWLKKQGSVLLLIPASISLGIFVFLLSLHPVESGRVYAAYGGIYIITAMLWLILVDKSKPNLFDIFGALIILLGSALMVAGWRTK